MNSRDNMRQAKSRNASQLQPQQSGTQSRRVPERTSQAPSRYSQQPSRITGGPQGEGSSRQENELPRQPHHYPMKGKLSLPEVDKELEKMVSDTHDQAMKDLEEQMAALKKRIWSNKEILESTTRTLKSINFEGDKRRAQSFRKTPAPSAFRGLGDLNVNRDWDKRLEEVTAEIHRVRNTLSSNNEFQANISSGIEEFHKVLQETMSTIRSMSAKSSDVRASKHELNFLMKSISKDTSEMPEQDKPNREAKAEEAERPTEGEEDLTGESDDENSQEGELSSQETLSEDTQDDEEPTADE